MYNSDKRLLTYLQKRKLTQTLKIAFRLIDAGDERGFELLNEIWQ